MPTCPSTVRALLRHALIVLLLGAALPAARATLITFEERPWIYGPEEYAWYSNPITTEYDGLGVRITDGYLQPADPLSAGFPNTQFLLGGPFFGISFTNDVLPSFVSLAFSSPLPGLRATVSAYGTGGTLLGSFDTGGEYWAGPEQGWISSRPYQARSLASFHADSGISFLSFGTEGSTRITGKIDNLYFGQVAAVPEPAMLALWAVGLVVIALLTPRSALRRHGKAR
jgi:hypothetical protein